MSQKTVAKPTKISSGLNAAADQTLNAMTASVLNKTGAMRWS